MPTFRLAQPHAAVVIDSVDVAFAREELTSKVGVQSVVEAEETKRRELAKYRAADARDVHQMIELTATYHTPARGRALARKARLWWAEAAVFHAGELLVKVGFAPASRQIVEALRLSHNRRVVRKIFSFLVLWFRIMGSRLKRWLKSKLITSFTAKSTNDDPDSRR